MYETPADNRNSSWTAEWRALTSSPAWPHDPDSWAGWSYLPGSHQKAIGRDAHSDGGGRGQLIRLLIAGGAGLITVLVLWLIQAPSPGSGFEHAISQVFGFIFVLFIGVVIAGLAYGVAVTVDWLNRFRHTVATARQPEPITLDSFRTGSYDERHPGRSVSTEGKLVTVATHTARMIEESRAWRSNHLDTHRVRLDLAEEVRQLADRAVRLHDTRAKLGNRPSPDSATLTHAATLWDEQSRTADLVLQSLTGRLNALISYRAHVDLLSRELDALDMVSGGEISDELAALLAGSVADEQAAEHLRELSAQTQASVAAIQDVIQLIGHDLTALHTSPTR
ncbi:MAG TPA: hypothetical protein VFX16_08480 [Pseudonocardiaceae bacterium]|nr:hypothetical protein [Pseudonocardiaceae bacterium]